LVTFAAFHPTMAKVYIVFIPICIIVILYLYAHCKRPCDPYVANNSMYMIKVRYNMEEYTIDVPSLAKFWLFFSRNRRQYIVILEMWANAQRDDRPAEYRWRLCSTPTDLSR